MRLYNFGLVVVVAVTSCGRAELNAASDEASGSESDALGSGPDALWMCSNVGTPDLLELFRSPDAWPRARNSVKVMQFYGQQLSSTEPGQCSSCNDNLLPNLAAVDAFAKLDQWGIGIAIELGSLKHHTCDAEAAAQYASSVIGNVEAAGGKVRYIAMDEPYAGGAQVVNGQSCHLNMQQSAAQTAQFIKRLAELHPDVKVGDIEPYPFFRTGQLQAWLQELANNGVTPAFFHLDVDRNHAKNLNADVPGDLRALKAYAAGRGIPFGVIFWGMEIEIGNTNPSPDKAFYDSVMKWARTTQAAIGRPDHSIFQSWARLSDGRNVVPNNLTEGGYGLTRAVNDGWALLSPSAPPGPAVGGEPVKVARGYLGILGREADPGGLSGYSAFLSGGKKTVDFTHALFGSAEFAQNRAGLSNEQLGTELYRGILGREPDPGGLSYTVAELDARRGAERAAGMIDSDEFRSKYLAGP